MTREWPDGQWLGLGAFTVMAWVQSLFGELSSLEKLAHVTVGAGKFKFYRAVQASWRSRKELMLQLEVIWSQNSLLLKGNFPLLRP